MSSPKRKNSEIRTSLRFWRVALWGTATFLMFCVLFRHSFRALIAALIEKRGLPASVLLGPVLPSMFAATLALLFAALSLFALWKLRVRRDAGPVLRRFMDHNGELLVRLGLLVCLMSVGSSVPRASRFETCRCCLFTVEPACGRRQIELPSAGFYDFDSDAGRFSGIYPKGTRASLEAGNNLRLDRLAFEQVQVERTRFGWPLQAITRDVVRQEAEWHVAFEGWVIANLVFWFLIWLFIQALISLAKRFLRFTKSAEKADVPAGRVSV